MRLHIEAYLDIRHGTALSRRAERFKLQSHDKLYGRRHLHTLAYNVKFSFVTIVKF